MSDKPVIMVVDDEIANIELIGAMLEEAFLDAWNGVIEDGTFNRLILLAGLGGARPGTLLPAVSREVLRAGPDVAAVRAAGEKLRDAVAYLA